MSGEQRRFGGWLLPAIVVLVGAYFLVTGAQGGTLSAASLKPVNWVGVGAMAIGAVAALAGRKLWKLAGVVLCGVGAILVICL